MGILLTRHAWVNRELAVEDCLIEGIKAQGFGVIPVFSNSLRDDALGARVSAAAVCDYLFDGNGSPRIDALVKLHSFFLGNQKGVEVVATHKSAQEWRDDPHHLPIHRKGFRG